ncbi:MAG: hypothetical protein ACPG4U_02490 [Pseudomonadales bacterium]
MPEQLRYASPIIAEHLAQQYCLGLMSARTRERMEHLIQRHTVIAQAVISWQQHLSKLVDSLEEQPAPQHVWQTLERQLSLKDQPTPTASRWFQAWRKWLWPLGGTLCALSLCISLLLHWQQAPLTERSASYLAIMTSHTNHSDGFVLSAYQGLAPGQSQLKLQWLKGQQPDDIAKWELWGVERKSGKRVKIGPLKALIDSPALTKSSWLQIKHSSSLELVSNGKTRYSGLCLQLEPWSEQGAS